MKSDVLDILFEKRNKAYGAYDLRKFYGDRLMRSVGLMLASMVVLSAFTFLPRKKTYETTPYTIIEENGLGKVKPPEKKLPEPKKTVVAQKAVSTTKLVSRITIVKNNDTTDVIRNIDKEYIGSVTITIPDPGGPRIKVADPITTGGNEGPVVIKPVVDRTEPQYTAELMPSFPGGMDALKRFLERNLNNPKDLEVGNQVSVKVQFVVGYDGKLQRFQVIQDGGEAFNNEVLRVLKKMPAWIPGKSSGENVSVYYTIPVKFVPAE